MPSTLRDNSDLSQHQRAKPGTGSTGGAARPAAPTRCDGGEGVSAAGARLCVARGICASIQGASVRRGSLRVSARRKTPACCAGSGRRAASACAPAAPSSRGSGRRGSGKGGGVLKIDSDSPERGHGAIPGTFPLHPVTLLCKTILSEEGAGSWSPGGLRGGAAGRRRGQTGRGPTALPPLAPTPAGTPPVHTSKHGPREGEAPARPLSQGLFVAGSGSHCFWLQTPKLTKFWEILSSVTCVGQLPRQEFGASSTQTLHSGKHAC